MTLLLVCALCRSLAHASQVVAHSFSVGAVLVVLVTALLDRLQSAWSKRSPSLPPLLSVFLVLVALALWELARDPHDLFQAQCSAWWSLCVALGSVAHLALSLCVMLCSSFLFVCSTPG